MFCGLMGITMFASLGLPGLNGFVGEFLIFKGAFALVPWAAVLAVPRWSFTAVHFTVAAPAANGQAMAAANARPLKTVCIRFIWFPCFWGFFILTAMSNIIAGIGINFTRRKDYTQEEF